MIRFAEPRDHIKLKKLWHDIFGDPEDYLDFYFKRRHLDANMLVDESQGTIAGMLTMLPVELMFGRESRHGRYVYAVATDPGFRGQGISTSLLEHAHDIMIKEGTAASVLVPASGSLFGFYEKRGYQTAFFLEHVSLQASKLPPCAAGAVCLPCTGREFLRLRDAAFSGSRLYVRWDEQALEFIIDSEAVFGNPVLSFGNGTGEGCAVCRRDGNRGPCQGALSFSHGARRSGIHPSQGIRRGTIRTGSA